MRFYPLHSRSSTLHQSRCTANCRLQPQQVWDNWGSSVALPICIQFHLTPESSPCDR